MLHDVASVNSSKFQYPVKRRWSSTPRTITWSNGLVIHGTPTPSVLLQSLCFKARALSSGEFPSREQDSERRTTALGNNTEYMAAYLL